MSYLFNTTDDRDEMLKTIGVGTVAELFEQIPPQHRLGRPLAIGEGLSEPELEKHLRSLAAKNGGVGSRISFLGGGIYDHFIPAAVDEIARRGEFYTAYTPYQAEASQGSLQAFFEFQSLICDLTGMDVSNASLYEGGTACSEAAFMAMRVTRRHGKVVVLGSVHPEYRQVVETYCAHLGTQVVVVETPDGTACVDEVRETIDAETAALVIQQPNFFGCLEDVQNLVQIARDAGALSIVSVDPISLGVLKRPGEYGADIVVAEGQSLGIPLQYGGPLLGILACRKEYVRRMPGRLIGKTTDADGKECYVLNLQAREQHIRRDKATSNICTNQGLLALRATVFLSLLGKQGLREMAELCLQKSHYAAERLESVGVQRAFAAPFFKEFAAANINPATARDAGFDVGPELAVFGPHRGCLVAVTEQRSQSDIDALAECLSTSAS